MPYRPKEIVKALQKLGFDIHRQAGSHAILKNAEGYRVTIPIHNKDLKAGTFHSILKQANLSEQQLKDAL